MLRYFLENGLINITDKHPQNWEEAIRISGEIMKKNNLVTDEYIDQVIADVKEVWSIHCNRTWCCNATLLSRK